MIEKGKHRVVSMTNKKTCFVIVTHNRREDFNKLIASINANRYYFNAYNVDLIVFDNESDELVPTSPDYLLYRMDCQASNGGLAGAWETVTQIHINEYDYFIYSNHDVIINPSIRQFFSSLTSLTGSFVLGPTSHPGGANPHQNGPARTSPDLVCNLQEKLPKQPDLIHGFFWATNRDSLIKAKYSPDEFFNPDKPFAGTEDDWQLRLLQRDPSTRFLVEKHCFIEHKHYSDWRKK